MDLKDNTAALREQVVSLIEDASEVELAWVASILRAARRPVTERLLPTSDIVSREFANDFAARLRFFHALHDSGEALTKKAFEFAFKGASGAAGRNAIIVDSATHRGADVIVDGVRFSLKTEAAKDIRPDQITISKLMESAWTKGFRTAADFLAVVPRIVMHLHQYERIVILRAFGRLSRNRRITYELVEIPRDVLLLAANAQEPDCSQVTMAGGTSVIIRTAGGEHAYTLVFDGSDQKITVKYLSKRLCRIHGTWTIVEQGFE